MFVWLGRKRKVRRKPGGRRERLRCPECGVVANFTECELTESLSAFSVLELSSDKETVYRCGECGELCEMRKDGAGDIEDLGDAPVESRSISPAEQARIQRQALRERKLEEAKQRILAEKRMQEQRAETQRQERSASVDDELAALKRKLQSE